MLENTKIQSQAIEALVDSMPSCFTPLHKIVHNSNESVSQLVMSGFIRFECHAKHEVTSIESFTRRREKIIDEKSVATPPIQPQNTNPPNFIMPVKAFEPKLKEKIRRVKEMKMPNSQQEPERE